MNQIKQFYRKMYKQIAFYWVWFKRWRKSKHIKVNPRKIVFLTINNMYTCNPKYIAEELLKRNLDYELVWMTTKKVIVDNHFFPKGITLRFINTPEAFIDIMSAKVINDNGFKYQEGHYLPKLPGQIYIETWHGSLGLKRFGAKYDSVKTRVKAAKRCGKLTDFCISNSDFETNLVYHGEFWPTASVWKVGHPRNDILINANSNEQKELKQKICEIYQIDEKKKIALYAPTFRDDMSEGYYQIELYLLQQTLKRRFSGEWHIMIRYHFISRNLAVTIQENDYVTNVTNYTDMQELLAITDVGITDYSSWICDFVLTKKPAFLFATDISAYENERGFYYPLKTTPFPLATSNDELMENILNFDEKSYVEKCDNFIAEKGCEENGSAAFETVNKIIQLMEQ